MQLKRVLVPSVLVLTGFVACTQPVDRSSRSRSQSSAGSGELSPPSSDEPQACTPSYQHGSIDWSKAILGTVDASDRTQVGRLAPHEGPGETFVDQTCEVQKPTPRVRDADQRFHYDAWVFRNSNAAAACISITLIAEQRGARPLQVQEYLGSFDPENVDVNYLGDHGGSFNSAYVHSVMVPGESNFVIVVSGVPIGHAGEAEGSDYGLAVGGCTPRSGNGEGEADGGSGPHEDEDAGGGKTW